MVSVSRPPGRTVCLLKCALFQVSRTGHSTPEQKPVPICVNSAQGPEKSHMNSNLQVRSGTEKCNPKEGGKFMLCRSQKMRPPAFGMTPVRRCRFLQRSSLWSCNYAAFVGHGLHGSTHMVYVQEHVYIYIYSCIKKKKNKHLS